MVCSRLDWRADSSWISIDEDKPLDSYEELSVAVVSNGFVITILKSWSLMTPIIALGVICECLLNSISPVPPIQTPLHFYICVFSPANRDYIILSILYGHDSKHRAAYVWLRHWVVAHCLNVESPQ